MEPWAELVSRVESADVREALRALIAAGQSEPVEIDAETQAEMMRPYSWLLDRIGDDGLKLTGSGYLPPAEVEAIYTALGIGREWIHKSKREVQNPPVLDFRESAAKLGLISSERGSLMLTDTGRRLREDPVALWWWLAERLPLDSDEEYTRDSGFFLLILLAAGHTTDLAADIAGYLTASGSPVSAAQANAANWETRGLLLRISALKSQGRRSMTEVVTPEGIAFARAVIRTWPG
ncbi:hypothetical protein [Fodinicola acaciae]|uniref:hypothetical protein n=1 Tax=Fodinicola acaciae TaxID=2681555 RepID=UPI0013D49B85|nr:hypothetical protein [Fodinicola acaciae]